MSDPLGKSAPPSGERSTDYTQKAGVQESGERSLPLAAEDLSVSKETVETGRLRVRTETHTRDASVEADLLREEAIIETIPKGHRIFAVPAAREEGDRTIIPVVEEIIYTEKHLILKEEIHVIRQRKTERFHDTVALRHQEAVVSRTESASEPPSIEKEHGQQVKKSEE